MNGKVFPSDQMTSRERLLAAYRGQPVDRLPYWAKVGNPTWRSAQPEATRKLSNRALLDYIHADGIFGSWIGLTIEQPHVQVDRTEGASENRVVTHTPDGALTERWGIDPATKTAHPVEFPVKTIEDVRRFRWLYQDVKIRVNGNQRDALGAIVREVGERGILMTACGTSPLMHLVQHVIGPVETHIMLHEYPREIEELMALMHRHCLDRVETIARYNTVADVMIVVENTSTTLISPAQFKRYCLGHLLDYCRVIRSYGKLPEFHMCGHLKALLPVIDTIPAASIEAFTSPTVGNTRLADGRTLAPSKTLVGGTNVNTWRQPLAGIKRYIEDELAACPDHRHIVLTTAGVAPPACDAEKFRAIGKWLAGLPVRT